MSEPTKTRGILAERARTGAVTIAVAVLLTGCSPSASPTEATPTASVEERYQAQLAEQRLEALVEPLSPLPAAAPTTPAGTMLGDGEWAVVGRERAAAREHAACG